MKSVNPSIEAYTEKPLVESGIGAATINIPLTWQWRLFTALLVVNDSLVIAAAFRLAYLIRFQLNISFFELDVIPSIEFYQKLVGILIPVWLVIFAVSGLYNRQNLIGGTKEYSRLFNGVTFGIFSLIAVGFLVPEFIFSRAWLLLSWLVAMVMVGISRFALRRVVYGLRYRGFFLSPALIIGANEEGKSLALQLQQWVTSGLHVIGFVDDDVEVGSTFGSGLTNLGTLNGLEELVKKHNIEEVILTSSALSREQILHIFKLYGVSKDVNVRMSSGLYEIITTGLQVKEFAYVPLVGINKVRLTGLDSLMKFLLDYSIALPAMFIVAPIALLISLLIKLDSPGPIIHRRRVMGVNGTQFDAFKFRTMHVNGDDILNQYPALKAELALTQKLKDDPRVTRVGKFLRKWSLDELPQIFNVLRREMSIVGPRMISPPEMEFYQQYGMNLLTVKPGITGLWQVSGRSDVSYAERVRLDMYYVRNWSIWLDFQLLVQTIPAVLRKRGAY